MQKLLSFGFTVYLNSVGGEVSSLSLLQHVVGRVQPAVGLDLLEGRAFPATFKIISLLRPSITYSAPKVIVTFWHFDCGCSTAVEHTTL